jgi:hypothetical protein
MIKRTDVSIGRATRARSSRSTFAAIFALLTLLLANFSTAEVALDSSMLAGAQDDAAREEWAYSLGVQAYVFGLPLVIFERETALRVNAEKIARIRHMCPCEMLNGMGHKENLATADDVMPYTPNNDTVYSGALLNFSDEPMIVSLPDIEDRYWSLQVANPYTENKFYVGSRATGGKGGHHAFIAPGWQGELPDGVVPHHLDYDSAMIALRIGVIPGDEEDLRELNKLQRQAVITSLSNFSDESKRGQAAIPEAVMSRPRFQGELAFFQLMAAMMTEFPPAPQHEAMVNQFRLIGLEVGVPFEPDALDEPTRRGLMRALADGKQIMKWKVKYRGTPYVTRWNNLHPGTYGFDYFDRAAGALEGLFVHDRDEAVYFSTYESADGEFLDGSKKYKLHFDKDELPPTMTNGFWSLTMYGLDFQLVKNSIDRFSIGDRTPGLKYNDDGSLDVYIQNTPPEGRESNWLPTPPEGIFRINYRIYLPQERTRNPQTLEQYIPGIAGGDDHL